MRAELFQALIGILQSTYKGMRNRGLENLARRLAKLMGYELEFRAHEVRLL
jgi:hypothetical protein